MPELPEVEVICRGLRPYLVGRRVESISHNGKQLRCAVPIDPMRSHLLGQQITSVERRAKYLLIHFNPETLLIIHLGMTGQLGIFRTGSPTLVHDHIFWHLDNRMELRYNDTRRFGSVHLLAGTGIRKQKDHFFARTGLEPFSDTCTATYLQIKAKGKKQPVKTFLMNTEVIAGIGNIYANESLFRAKLHPGRQAGKLKRKEWDTLLYHLRETLRWAIACGGSTISDFINASGEKGYFQANFSVYGKAGEACSTCQTIIEKSKQSGRSTFFCPLCQRQ